MCGRYSFTLPPEAIRELFRVVTVLNLQPRYNIAPTQDVPVIGLEPSGERALRMFRWGLVPRWSKELPKSAPLINARSEGIAGSKMFGEAFQRRRCPVPADGFFEWNQDKSLKDKTPWRMVDPGRPSRSPACGTAGAARTARSCAASRSSPPAPTRSSRQSMSACPSS